MTKNQQTTINEAASIAFDNYLAAMRLSHRGRRVTCAICGWSCAVEADEDAVYRFLVGNGEVDTFDREHGLHRPCSVNDALLRATQMTVYSCRAELAADAQRFVCRLLEAIEAGDDICRYVHLDMLGCPTLEFQTTLDLDALRRLLNQVSDSHVMRETLRPVPLADNSLERDREMAGAR